MHIAAGIALIVFGLVWLGGGLFILPYNLYSTGERRFIKRRGRLYRNVYSLWQPVREVIPFLLYVPKGQAFYLDDYGFERGR